jgi:integrase
LRELTWNDVDTDARTITLRRPIKKKTGDRTIALADDAWRIIERLREIQDADCDWVFPSRRQMPDGAGGFVRGHLDAIDRFGDTSHGDLRHYWMTIARGACALHVQRWLGLHTLTGDDLRTVGHYGEPTIDEQRDGANAIASAVNQALGRRPSNVVALDRDTA